MSGLSRTTYLGVALAVCAAAIIAPTTALADANCVNLIAGQSMPAGNVCTEIVDGDLCVTYTITDPWQMDEYHLWVGDDLADMPQNKHGSPKLGRFPYKATGLAGGNTPANYIQVCVPPTDGAAAWCDLAPDTNVVAHAVVTRDSDGDGILDETQTGFGEGPELGGNSWAMQMLVPLCDVFGFDAGGLADELVNAAGVDMIVGLQVSHQGGNPGQPYFVGQLDYDQDGTSEQTGLDFYCVDLAHTIGGGWYCARMYSSYSNALPAEIINPENFDEANYVLNTFSIGDDLGNDTLVSGGDIQRTLWSLVYGTLPGPGAYSSGPSNNQNVDAMLAAAFSNGSGFEPSCEGSVAVVVYPVDCNDTGIAGQVLIAQVLVTEFPAACTALSCSTVCGE